MQARRPPLESRYIFLVVYPFSSDIDVMDCSLREANARALDARLRGLLHGIFTPATARVIALICDAGGAVNYAEPLPTGIEAALIAWVRGFDRSLASRRKS